MKKWFKYTLIVFLAIILILATGITFTLKNTSDYNTSELELDDILADVKVYRDDKGIPTIIADNMHDLFFTQGYEMARDRLWQMQFLMSVGNGELSRLLGDDYIEADKYLRTLSMRYASDINYEKLSDYHKQILSDFVDGINKYIEIHENNLPLEFFVANSPRLWKPKDALAIQGVMAQDLSLRGINSEFLRQDLASAIGVEKTQELFPIIYQPAADYFTNNYTVTKSNLVRENIISVDQGKIYDILGDISLGGSNNWVVSGNITDSGNPILSNDPHLGLSTPSIWWQVQLVAPGYHVQGFALPGVPGVVTGHNENVMWGVTNTGTDAVDLYYLTTNDKNQYWYKNEWKDFVIESSPITLENGSIVDFEIRRSELGVILDHEFFGIKDGRTYAMQWTLWEKSERNNLMKAIFDLNSAKSVDEVHEVLYYWSVPGQNVVFADTKGNIGYQYTGMTPIRSNGTYGVAPLNGSDGISGWDGYVDYNDHYYVKNPSNNFFSSANEQIDPTESFYITDVYAIGYRGERIIDVLSNKENRPLSIEDMENLQDDTLNLYAKLLQSSIDYLGSVSFEDETVQEAVDIMTSWDQRMEKNSVGATLFATFRIFFEEYTIRDELDAVNNTLFPRSTGAAKYLIKNIAKDKNSVWFDNITTSEIETSDDIAKQSMISAVAYLEEKIGGKLKTWVWGEVHTVEFSHVMGGVIKVLNTGKVGSDGSSFTVKASNGSPRWSADGPQYSQSHGPSYRMIGEVEPSWKNVEGILVPGSSGHILSKHYDDGIDDWIDNVYHQWDFVTSIDGNPTFIFKKKSQ